MSSNRAVPTLRIIQESEVPAFTVQSAKEALVSVKRPLARICWFRAIKLGELKSWEATRVTHPGRQGPEDETPFRVDEWVGYDWPDEVKLSASFSPAQIMRVVLEWDKRMKAQGN